MTSSIVGGSQFSIDNRTNNVLFDNISMAEMMEQLKAEERPMGYTGRIQANSMANYAKNPRSELANVYNVCDRDISLYQYKGFMNDKIDASSRATQSASRFNYGYDRQVNKRYVDVSGQFIPNNKLRVIPNRGCMMNGAFPLAKPPADANLERLSAELAAEASGGGAASLLRYMPSSANKYYSYKASRPKLTRQDLTNSAQQYAMAKPSGLANPVATVANAVAVAGGFDALASARRRQEQRDEIAANLRETRGLRGLGVQLPMSVQVGALG
jgi:hypothetical protein